MNSANSTYHRTLVKTATYRIAALLADIGVVYALTGRVDTALAFGGIMVVFSTAIYFAHERAWSRVSWGYKNGNGKN